jgi:UDP-N-acetylglucosamine acyltransferase
MARVHASALVDPAARLADDVEVGAFSTIGPDVSIGAGTRIGPHVVVEGPTAIGRDNRISPFCSIGGPPQDKKYGGEPTRLEIGDRNVLRECCTVNRGTVQDAGVTRIGDDNWIMAYVHVAHDCVIGSQTILANSTQLAGHVHIGDWVFLAGMTGVHQFVQIGAHAMTSANAYLSQDLPPYVLGAGTPAEPHGINAEGLKRRGFSAAAIAAIRLAYKTLYRAGLSLEDARKTIADMTARADAEIAPHLRLLSDFLASATRGIAR